MYQFIFLIMIQLRKFNKITFFLTSIYMRENCCGTKLEFPSHNSNSKLYIIQFTKYILIFMRTVQIFREV